MQLSAQVHHSACGDPYLVRDRAYGGARRRLRSRLDLSSRRRGMLATATPRLDSPTNMRRPCSNTRLRPAFDVLSAVCAGTGPAGGVSAGRHFPGDPPRTRRGGGAAARRQACPQPRSERGGGERRAPARRTARGHARQQPARRRSSCRGTARGTSGEALGPRPDVERHRPRDQEPALGRQDDRGRLAGEPGARQPARRGRRRHPRRDRSARRDHAATSRARPSPGRRQLVRDGYASDRC